MFVWFSGSLSEIVTLIRQKYTIKDGNLLVNHMLKVTFEVHDKNQWSIPLIKGRQMKSVICSFL